MERIRRHCMCNLSICLLGVVLKLALSESHDVKEVGSCTAPTGLLLLVSQGLTCICGFASVAKYTHPSVLHKLLDFAGFRK